MVIKKRSKLNKRILGMSKRIVRVNKRILSLYQKRPSMRVNNKVNKAVRNQEEGSQELKMQRINNQRKITRMK